MKVLILGRAELLHATATYLRDHTAHRVVGVITARAMPEYQKREDDFRVLAESCGARFLLTQKLDDEARALIRDAAADVAVSVNWVTTLDETVTSMFPHGIVNAHFGDLPRFRGNAVTNWALLLHEPEIALTVHRMAPSELDVGDVFAQTRMALTQDTTIAEINAFATAQTPALFARALDGLADGSLRGTPQAAEGAFRCYPRLPRDGKLDWGQSAKDLHALVRSLTTPYSGAYTYYRDRDDRLVQLYVWRSRLVADDTRDVAVPGHVIRNDAATGESWVHTGRGVLALAEVSHGADGARFAPGATWKSIRMRLGMDLDDEIFRLANRP